MSYKNLIDNKLKLAFNLAKDLAVDAILTKKVGSTFNFGIAETQFSSAPTVATKIVITDSDKKSQDRNTIHSEIMLKSSEVGDLTNYATISFNSQNWNFAQIQKNDGFILIANVYREA